MALAACKILVGEGPVALVAATPAGAVVAPRAPTVATLQAVEGVSSLWLASFYPY